MESIRDIIPHVIESLTLKKPNTKLNIQDVWRLAVGVHAEHCSVQDFQKGMLRVHVDSSARMFDLSTKKSEIIKTIQKEIPGLTDIIFKVGKIK
jgi:hypothetical protein